MSDDPEQTRPSSAEKSARLARFNRILVRVVGGFFAAIFVVGLVAVGVRWATMDHSLGAKVGYQYTDDGSGAFLTVEVLDTTGWNSPRFIVNGVYRVNTGSLEPGGSYLLDLTKFTSESGESFRPDRLVPKNVRVEAGWAWGEWVFP